MQRADKIGLIVASLLVVALSTGAGLLLYQRSVTLAADTPRDTSVKLVALEDTATAVVPTVTPAATPKPVVPKKPQGSDFGYVTAVGGSGKDMYLKWDQAELLTGNDADVYAKKNGAVVNTRLYYIANDTHKTKTYDVSSKATFEMAGADGTVSKLSAPEFAAQWKAGGAIRKTPWWLFARQGNVVRLVQVVLPKDGQ